jgi:4-amino-4-deoxy-L-arabinose transferase-like glycosyltransferase
MQTKYDWNYLLVAALAGLFFLPFLGGVHLFDWDEINFAECSREMLETGSYLRPQINYEPFWEKPPLFMWFQALSMHIFGINDYAARFPNAVCGIATLLIIYHVGKKLYNPTFGWLWVLSYLGSILPHLYFRSGIIDPWFNLFIFLSLLFLIDNNEENSNDNSTKSTPSVFKASNTRLAIGGVFLGLAILTKGPAAYVIVSLTWAIKLLIYRELTWAKVKNYALFSIAALLTTSLWFGVETIKNGPWFLKTFIEYNIRLAQTEDAGHGGFVGYHFVVILFGCFPASIFAIQTFFKKQSITAENQAFTRWMKTLFWVVIIVFSLVESKIVHYSSMCYLPLTFLSALTLKSMLETDVFPSFFKKIIIGIGLFFGIIFAAVPFVGQRIDLLKPLFAKDAFGVRNLDAAVTWMGWESLAGIFLIFTLLLLPKVLKSVGILRGYFFLFLSIGIFINAVLYLFINNIEGYSQNAAIEFYKNKATEDCYMSNFGFKSYAHLYYARKRPPTNPLHTSGMWLYRGNVDKPTYFIAKYPDKDSLDGQRQLQFLYDKNGFVFYKRVTY